MKELPHTRSCFVCGEANASGLNLRFTTDGNIVRTTFIAHQEYIGFKGVVHGGIIATLLDEIMVWACAVRTKRFAFCADLNIRFLKPLPPGQATEARAELVENRREKIFLAKAELLLPDGTVIASATGKYIRVPTAQVASMAEDFVGAIEI
jgi:uncharacterized protein (TIGR00369 family)